MGKKKGKTSDEDISLDLSFLKNFKPKNISKSLQRLNIDYKVLIVLALILLPMLLSVYFRVQSAYLPVTDDWAESTVYNGIRNNIQSQVNQQYPNLPQSARNDLINQQLNNLLSDPEQKKLVDQRIEMVSGQFKERLQTEEGQTYLLAIDPYQWYRWSRNAVEKGHFYDEMRNGTAWNTHKIAPLGESVKPSLHVTFSVWIYRIVHFFNSNLPLMTVFFYIPVLFSALSVIPAFFLARKKGGNFGGFVAATLVAVHTSFLGRTAAGFTDTDAYNVFFPLIITWIFIEAFETKNLWKKGILSGLAGLTIGIYSQFWGGWWYIFDFLIVVLAAYIGYVIVKYIIDNGFEISKIIKEKSIINTLFAGGLFVIFSGIFVTVFTNFSSFTNSFMEALNFRIIKRAALESLWPNVLTTVAELGDTNIPTIVNVMGGKLLFFIAMLGVVLTMMSSDKFRKKDWILLGSSTLLLLLLISDKMMAMSPMKYLLVFSLPLVIGILLTLKDNREVDVKYALFLTIWFVGTIYATTKGMRFTLLLVPAFAVAVGISVGLMHRIFTRWISRESKMDVKIVGSILAILFLIILVSPLKSAANVAPNQVPSMNDAWWDSLTKIKQESQPDAIVNSWWDFGHWFKAIADRAVTFDGASQNTPMAHWIGKTLLTDDEDVAIGILRMLDCGSNNAYETLLEITDDEIDSIKILNEIIVMNEESASDYLREVGFNQDETSQVLDYTHCSPPENYFITSSDMVNKAGVWAHFGSWDFEKAYIYTRLRRMNPEDAIQVMMDKFGYDRQMAQNRYYDVARLTNEEAANSWISPWPRYITGSWTGCSKVNESMTCNFGIGIGSQDGQQIALEQAIVNLDDIGNSSLQIGAYDSAGNRLGGNTGVPTVFAIADEENITKYRFDNPIFSYAILVDTVNNRAMVAETPLVDSIFTKLFFFNGRYTEHFTEFSDMTSFNNQRIIVWKVDWPSND